MKHFDKPLPRVQTYLPGGGGGGGGGGEGRTLIFSHMCRLRPFLGVQNLLISIFLGIYVYVNKSTPPPPPHTHTHTLGIHLSAIGFGAHRICACADPHFYFFSSAYFTEGPYA